MMTAEKTQRARRRPPGTPETYTAWAIDVDTGGGWRPLQPPPVFFSSEDAAWTWLCQYIGDCGMAFRVRSMAFRVRSEERPCGMPRRAGNEAYTDHRARSTGR